MDESLRQSVNQVQEAAQVCIWTTLDLIDSALDKGTVAESNALKLLQAMKDGQRAMNPGRVPRGLTKVQDFLATVFRENFGKHGEQPCIGGSRGACYHGAALNLVKLRVFAGLDNKAKAVETEVTALTESQLSQITANVLRLDREKVEEGSALIEREYSATGVPIESQPLADKGKRSRSTKQDVRLKTLAALAHKAGHPDASEKECAEAVGIARTTLIQQPDWPEWVAKIEKAAASGRLPDIKKALDKRTGEIVPASGKDVS